MLRFCNEEITVRVKAALAYCSEYRIDFEFYDIENPETYDEEITIDEYTEISLCLPQCHEYVEISIGEMFNCLNEIKLAKILNNYLYISPRRIIVRVDSHNREKINAYEEEIDNVFETAANFNGQIINFDLIDGFTNFGLLISEMDEYDKYFPPILYEDLFIEITSNNDICENIVEELIQAYIFELSSSLNIEIFISPRQNYYDLEYDIEEHEKKMHLRPLSLGKGVKDLLTIYNSTTKINDADILILFFTKVIEYVSQTVVRRELLDTILNKLYSPRALTPSASYVLELEKAFDELGNYKKDKEAIRLTIEICSDILELQGNVPIYLKNLSKINVESTKEEKKQAVLELASAISDTRNMIAHAKTNYKNKGYECPQNEMDALAKCLKIVASQVIRWFLRQHEDNRII